MRSVQIEPGNVQPVSDEAAAAVGSLLGAVGLDDPDQTWTSVVIKAAAVPGYRDRTVKAILEGDERFPAQLLRVYQMLDNGVDTETLAAPAPAVPAAPQAPSPAVSQAPRPMGPGSSSGTPAPSAAAAFAPSQKTRVAGQNPASLRALLGPHLRY